MNEMNNIGMEKLREKFDFFFFLWQRMTTCASELNGYGSKYEFLAIPALGDGPWFQFQSLRCMSRDVCLQGPLFPMAMGTNATL